VVDAIHNGYGEGAPRGTGPSQGLIQQQGNTYLKAKFPGLDYIKTARVVE
jgi:peptidyl-prolyl cis-trans isomerase A (cyclophilin A)